MERPELHVVKSLIEELTGSAPEMVEGVKPPSGGLESWKATAFGAKGSTSI
jgi:hypothetical protein